MTRVFFQKKCHSKAQMLELADKESLLDGLLRSGIEVTFGCKGGICQSCLMQSTEGEIPAASQVGLTPRQREQNLFLSCQCFPKSGFVAVPAGGTAARSTRVIEKTKLSSQVFRLRVENTIKCRAGEFLNIWKDKKTVRSYSVANVPERDGFIEFHIKQLKGGAFSEWAWNHLQPNQMIEMQGPLGNCTYSSNERQKSLFLCGIGTGLAPLYGIIREALLHHHQGRIDLYLASRSAEGFYLADELTKLENEHQNFTITFISGTAKRPNDFPRETINADVYEYTQNSISDLAERKIFLCGAPSFVQKMRKICFLAGASMANISADAFIAAQ